MYKRHIQLRSRSHYPHGKAISITYSECVCVALVIQRTKRMCNVWLWPVWRYDICPHYLLHSTTFCKSAWKKECLF